MLSIFDCVANRKHTVRSADCYELELAHQAIWCGNRRWKASLWAINSVGNRLLFMTQVKRSDRYTYCSEIDTHFRRNERRAMFISDVSLLWSSRRWEMDSRRVGVSRIILYPWYSTYSTLGYSTAEHDAIVYYSTV